MKKLTLWSLMVFCFLVGFAVNSIFFSTAIFNEKEGEGKQGVVKTSAVDEAITDENKMHSQGPDDDVYQKLDNSKVELRVDERDDQLDWYAFGAQQEPRIKQAYMELNDSLYGALKFDNLESYMELKENGFPTAAQIQIVNEETVFGLQKKLLKMDRSSGDFKTIAALTLNKAMSEFEAIMKYYEPEYKIGDTLPDPANYSNGRFTDEQKEAYNNLVRVSSYVDGENALSHLVLARFSQLNMYNSSKKASSVKAQIHLSIASHNLSFFSIGENSNNLTDSKDEYATYLKIHEAIGLYK
jgi:hypothetical protein